MTTELEALLARVQRLEDLEVTKTSGQSLTDILARPA